MMEWLRRHPFWTGVLIFGGCLAFHCYNALQLYLDFTAVKQAKGPPSAYPADVASWSVSHQYEIDLASGVEPPDGGLEAPSLGDLVNSPENGTLFGPEDGIRKYLKQVPELARIQDELFRRLTRVVASWPVAGPEREFNHPLAPSPNYRVVRDAARFWCLLAWDLARQGDARRALLAICGPAILGTYLEIREAQVEGATLFGVLVGNAFRRMSGLGLAELAPSIKPSKAMAQEVLAWLEEVEAHTIPFQRVLRREKNLLPSVAHFLTKEMEKGHALRLYGRNPRAMVRVLANRRLIDSYLDPIFGEAIKAAEQPYPAARTLWKEVGRQKRELASRIYDLGWHWLGYILRPERFLLDYYAHLDLPDVTKAYVLWLTGKAILRGGAAAVVIHAYRQEKNAWPDTVAQLQTWLEGKRYPVDPFTNAPFAYEGGAAPRLFSPGPDLATGTSDDLKVPLLPPSETSTTGRR